MFLNKNGIPFLTPKMLDEMKKGVTVAAVYAPVTLPPALTKGSGLINAKISL